MSVPVDSETSLTGLPDLWTNRRGAFSQYTLPGLPSIAAWQGNSNCTAFPIPNRSHGIAILTSYITRYIIIFKTHPSKPSFALFEWTQLAWLLFFLHDCLLFLLIIQFGGRWVPLSCFEFIELVIFKAKRHLPCEARAWHGNRNERVASHSKWLASGNTVYSIFMGNFIDKLTDK